MTQTAKPPVDYAVQDPPYVRAGHTVVFKSPAEIESEHRLGRVKKIDEDTGLLHVLVEFEKKHPGDARLMATLANEDGIVVVPCFYPNPDPTKLRPVSLPANVWHWVEVITQSDGAGSSDSSLSAIRAEEIATQAVEKLADIQDTLQTAMKAANMAKQTADAALAAVEKIGMQLVEKTNTALSEVEENITAAVNKQIDGVLVALDKVNTDAETRDKEMRGDLDAVTNRLNKPPAKKKVAKKTATKEDDSSPPATSETSD